MAYITVAFFTLGTIYEDEIKKLETSLKKFDMKYDFLGIADQGEWCLNCAYKSKFIRDMMIKHPDKDILYVDADAIIQRRPVLFDTFKGDIGVHYKDGKELLSGTIFLKNNGNTMALVENWIQEQERNPRVWDQKTLASVIKLATSDIVCPLTYLKIRVIDLPPTYTQIFDTMRNVGKPVIEHFQASRRVKNKPPPVPQSSEFIRVRVNADGSLWLSRSHTKTEAYLDEHYDRVTNEKKWFPRIENTEISDLQNIHIGKTVYMVGKGPSLDNLSSIIFPEDCVIIATNEAIHKVESLDLQNPTYVVQQDVGLQETCRPKNATILASYKCRSFYLDYPKKYLYHTSNFKLTYSSLSVMVAIAVAKFMGSIDFVFVSFDACLNKDTGYAKVIGHDSETGGNPDRFLKHKRKITFQARDCNINWLLPVPNMSHQDIENQFKEYSDIKWDHINLAESKVLLDDSEWI